MSRINDLTGQKFNKLTVLYQVEDHLSKNGNKRVVWRCKCECGNEVDVYALNLTRNHTKSCGCARKDGRKKLMRDVTNKRFGHLVGIKPINNSSGRMKWLFKCDCGNEVECYLSNVTSGKTKSCGVNCKLKKHLDNKKNKDYKGDLTGQKFGRLLVLERIVENDRIKFRCKCDCGNEKITYGNYLKSGTTKSCGCLHKELSGKTFAENLVGKRFGKLVVIKESEARWNKKHWLCKCDCGNENIVSTSGLKSGHTQSCGCFQDETASNIHFVDLTGRQFGKLTVIERAENSNTGMVRFLCKCECGNFTTVMNGHLLGGKIQSCGCWKYSSLEEYVIKYFEENNYINTVDYECQKKFKDLLGLGNMMLSYDFLVYKNNEPYYFIECQGKQHYMPVDYFGGEEKFDRQVVHDKLKKEYAKFLGIPMLEIPYTIKNYQEIVEILKQNGI